MISLMVNEENKQYQEFLDNILDLQINRIILEKLIKQYRENQEKTNDYIAKMEKINTTLIEKIKEYREASGTPAPKNITIGVTAPSLFAQRT